MITLKDLNIIEKCNEAIPYEFLTPSGKPSGVVLHIVGAHSTRVESFVNKRLNSLRAVEVSQSRRGKAVKVRPVEDDLDFGIEVIATRIVGWEGIEEEYTHDNAIYLCTINPEVSRQVKEFSEDIQNFTKG